MNNVNFKNNKKGFTMSDCIDSINFTIMTDILKNDYINILLSKNQFGEGNAIIALDIFKSFNTQQVLDGFDFKIEVMPDMGGSRSDDIKSRILKTTGLDRKSDIPVSDETLKVITSLVGEKAELLMKEWHPQRKTLILTYDLLQVLNNYNMEYNPMRDFYDPRYSRINIDMSFGGITQVNAQGQEITFIRISTIVPDINRRLAFKSEDLKKVKENEQQNHANTVNVKDQNVKQDNYKKSGKGNTTNIGTDQKSNVERPI